MPGCRVRGAAHIAAFKEALQGAGRRRQGARLQGAGCSAHRRLQGGAVEKSEPLLEARADGTGRRADAAGAAADGTDGRRGLADERKCGLVGGMVGPVPCTVGPVPCTVGGMVGRGGGGQRAGGR